MMSLWDALRMNMMISYQELVRTFLIKHMARKTLKLFVKNETPPKVTHEDLVKNRPRSPVRPPIPATSKTPDIPDRH